MLSAFEYVVQRLASKFRYSFNTREDILQNARLHCVTAMEKFNPDLPLQNFLMVHVHNRLCNDKRDNYERIDAPCSTCALYSPADKNLSDGCLEFDDRQTCDCYRNFIIRNAAKRNIQNTIDMEDVLHDDSHRVESNMISVENQEIAESKELVEIIERFLPVEHREVWIRLKEGLNLPKHRKDNLLIVIREILEDANWESGSR